MMNPRHLFFAALTGCLILTSPAIGLAAESAGSHKVDRAVREAIHNGSPTQAVIITVKPGFRPTIREALRQHGDVITSEHPLIEALAVEIHSADVDEIANQPWVESVAANAFVYAKTSSCNTNQVTQTVQSGELQSPSVGGTLRATLGLPNVAPSGTLWPTGATGVVIAIIDSGITPSDEFGGRIVGFYDFTRGGVSTAPFDDYGHGTHIAGLIGGSGKLSNYEYQG